MLAILALLVFVLATFGVALGSLNMIALGLALLSLHFVVGGWPWSAGPPWRRGQ